MQNQGEENDVSITSGWELNVEVENEEELEEAESTASVSRPVPAKQH